MLEFRRIWIDWKSLHNFRELVTKFMQDALLGSLKISAIAEIFLLIATIATIGKIFKFGIDLNVMFYYNISHKETLKVFKYAFKIISRY